MRYHRSHGAESCSRTSRSGEEGVGNQPRLVGTSTMASEVAFSGSTARHEHPLSNHTSSVSVPLVYPSAARWRSPRAADLRRGGRTSSRSHHAQIQGAGTARWYARSGAPRPLCRRMRVSARPSISGAKGTSLPGVPTQLPSACSFRSRE